MQQAEGSRGPPATSANDCFVDVAQGDVLNFGVGCHDAAETTNNMCRGKDFLAIGYWRPSREIVSCVPGATLGRGGGAVNGETGRRGWAGQSERRGFGVRWQGDRRDTALGLRRRRGATRPAAVQNRCTGGGSGPGRQRRAASIRETPLATGTPPDVGAYKELCGARLGRRPAAAVGPGCDWLSAQSRSDGAARTARPAGARFNSPC